MDTTFKKMNFKGGDITAVINAPQSFEPNIEAMSGLTTFVRDLSLTSSADFILIFCTQQSEIDTIAREANQKLTKDGLLWFAYPKGTSKKYKCDFNRDTGWAILGRLGFEGVRAVAIDEDWSALRFRKVEFVKKMTRSFAMTEEGKKKAGL